MIQTDAEIKAIFEEMSAGKQAEFAEYISTAKREDTKQNRLEKVLMKLRAGEGLKDKYRK